MSQGSLPSDSEMEKMKAEVGKMLPFEQAIKQPLGKRVR